MCYMLDQGKEAEVQGERSEKLYEIASVSKVVTSYWAIRELGPNFRFSTRIHITPVGRDIFDVHIQGGRDPFWGRQLTHFLFVELNKLNVREIRKLTFDENLGFRWSVVSDSIRPMNPKPQEIAKALEKHLQNLSAEYPQTRREAAFSGIQLPKSLKLAVGSVDYLPKSDFKPESDTALYVLKSSKLARYLKEMNTVSNNHVADRIFEYLGGIEKFKVFMQKDLAMDGTDIRFVNGSGDSVVVQEEDGRKAKVYNKASCDSMVRILYRMHLDLQKNHGLDLKDIMAVSGPNGGTLRPRYDSLRNSVVAKTGTVDPAITLAGMVATAKGNVYFGIFMGTDSPADWTNGRDRVRLRVIDLIKRFGGRKSFAYTSQDFLPFDQNSTLKSEVKSLDLTP